MTEWVYSLASAVFVSLIALVGIVTLIIGVQRLDQVIPLLVSLAVGALFGNSVVHLLPEAFEKSTSAALTSLYVLLGILLFMSLERFLHWHHEHTAQSLNPVHPMGHVILVADGAHNFLDGLIIGASYLVSPSLGLATTVAMILHEVPQELGDFGILVHSGFTPRRALTLNLLSGLLAILGVLISLLLGTNGIDYTMFMLPLAAGGFIYIAGADLIPELHKEREVRGSLAQLAMIILGGGLMYLLLLLG